MNNIGESETGLTLSSFDYFSNIMEPAAKRKKIQSSMFQFISKPQSNSDTDNANIVITDKISEERERPGNSDIQEFSSKVLSNDVGFIIKKVLNRETVTDEQRRMFLENRWTPQSKSERPFSLHGDIRRYLGSHYLEQYPRLAISRMEGLQGAWCLWCVLFHNTKVAGGSGYTARQQLGVLVTKPLTRYHKLTGKEGDLSCHNTAQYHLCSKERVFEFQNRATCRSEHDIRNFPDAARCEAIRKNRKILKPIIETILLCA